jgi:hypothetical protein
MSLTIQNITCEAVAGTDRCKITATGTINPGTDRVCAWYVNLADGSVGGLQCEELPTLTFKEARTWTFTFEGVSPGNYELVVIDSSSVDPSGLPSAQSTFSCPCATTAHQATAVASGIHIANPRPCATVHCHFTAHGTVSDPDYKIVGIVVRLSPPGSKGGFTEQHGNHWKVHFKDVPAGLDQVLVIAGVKPTDPTHPIRSQVHINVN